MGAFKRNFRLALMILTLPLNTKHSSETHFKEIIRKFYLIQPFFFILCLWDMLRGRKKRSKIFLNKQHSVEFPDHKFYLILRYLRVFWAYRISRILDTSAERWTLDAGLWTLEARLWELDTVVDWLRTESESGFWFCLIKLLNFF